MRERARRVAIRPFVVHAGPESSTNAGELAAQAWLRARGLFEPSLTPWHVEISMDTKDEPARLELDERQETRFRIEIYSKEWGVFFCHQGRASWIRITDIPFVHGRDDYRLLPMMPALKDIGQLLRQLERQHRIKFSREHALIRTNVPNAEPALRAWVRGL